MTRLSQHCMDCFFWANLNPWPSIVGSNTSIVKINLPLGSLNPSFHTDFTSDEGTVQSQKRFILDWTNITNQIVYLNTWDLPTERFSFKLPKNHNHLSGDSGLQCHPEPKMGAIQASWTQRQISQPKVKHTETLFTNKAICVPTWKKKKKRWGKYSALHLAIITELRDRRG